MTFYQREAMLSLCWCVVVGAIVVSLFAIADRLDSREHPTIKQECPNYEPQYENRSTGRYV